uniref:acetylornithine transaminase n=1 Tax=Corethron hystrix TaxID=216773 RepID=A0A7S1B6A0_9STRA
MDAFSPSSLHHARPSSSLAAVTTKTELVPPVDPLDASVLSSMQSKFEDYVLKTYGRYPLTLTSGKGCTLYAADGSEYLDFVAGIATCVLGHGHPALVAAVSSQMERLHHVSNLYLIPEQAALAEWLVSNSCADKAFFANSGAEANEGAIKLARKHASNQGVEEPVIITAIDSFHGRTLAAVTATGQPKYHNGFKYGGKMVEGFEYTKYNDVEGLRSLVEKINAEGKGKRKVAAIMMEALQGEGGILPGTEEFFLTARELCDATGALLICDEVQVGMGRSGKLWGYQNLGVEPDVFTSAKALGGGVPIGAMLTRGKASEVLQPGDHASTYGGNPLACAAALAVARTFSEDAILDNVNARGTQLAAGLESLAARYPGVLGAVRGWGLMRGVVVTRENTAPGEVVGKCMEEGLLLVAAGKDVVRFVPPLIVTEKEVERALEIFGKVVEKMAAE